MMPSYFPSHFANQALQPTNQTLQPNPGLQPNQTLPNEALQPNIFPYNQILDDDNSPEQQQLYRRVSGPN
jgi:hypothetical protein